MEISLIRKFAEQELQRLKNYYHFENPQAMNFPITVKITEELGELCNGVLAHSGLQRKEKLEQHNNENLAEEFADVILTTFILAQSMNVNIETGIERKMKKIEGRYHSQ